MGFSVTDTGIGIKPDDQEIIFEEFRQANGTAAREVEGTGLGLAISKRLVEMHDGSIWLESEYGEGTTFSFLLPLDGPSSRNERSEASAEGEGKQVLSRPPVLLVEANRLFNNLLTVYLRKAGYDPVQVYEGKKAVGEARELSPLVIILEVEAAKEDEWEILRRLKSDPKTKDIPVVLISALEDGKRALRLGTGEYVTASVGQESLETRVSRWTKTDPVREPPRVLVVDGRMDLVSRLREMVPDNGYSLIPAGDDEGLDDVALIAEGGNWAALMLRRKNIRSQEQAWEGNGALTPEALADEIRGLEFREPSRG
jgi:CheY-like chemotaxis protein